MARKKVVIWLIILLSVLLPISGFATSYRDYGGRRLTQPQYHFYVSDHLGNNRVDVCDGAVWQAMDYYPFGMPMASSYLSSKQRWLFGCKEMDRVNGLDLYDQEARQYDPTLGRFRSVDSYAEKYYPVSSYLFCAANPLAYTDPTGNDVFQVDFNGNFTKAGETKEYDRVEFVNSDGEIIKNDNGEDLHVDFAYRTLRLTTKNQCSSYCKKMDSFQVRGDKNAEKLFTFLCDNMLGKSLIEFSWIKTGQEGDGGLNFVNTGHVEKEEPALTWLYNSQLKYGYHIREIYHSHPIGRGAGDSDKKFFNQIKKHQNREIPNFIYHVPTKEYIQFYGK
ncbi:MAG: hypothetical protein K2M94_08105 [Paramuribaculum sp.]|nr:hypothetical protein [Paramuribaculum sp.]